jgi:hypothetical protein
LFIVRVFLSVFKLKKYYDFIIKKREKFKFF